jgi:hypothetical protein
VIWLMLDCLNPTPVDARSIRRKDACYRRRSVHALFRHRREGWCKLRGVGRCPVAIAAIAFEFELCERNPKRTKRWPLPVPSTRWTSRTRSPARHCQVKDQAEAARPALGARAGLHQADLVLIPG